MSPLATTLPQNTGSGYVAAAYIVFFVIVLIYVTIMAVRLTRVERDLSDLRARAGHEEMPGQTADGPATDAGGQASSSPEGTARPRERETV
jgi:hypothetical protein